MGCPGENHNMTTLDQISLEAASSTGQWVTPSRMTIAALHLGSAERKVTLAVLDLVLLSAALIAAVVLRTNLLPDVVAVISYAKWFVTLTALWFVVSAIFDAYNLARAANPTAGVVAALGAAGVTSIVYLMIPWLTPPLENRLQGFLFVLLATLGVTGWRLVYAHLLAQPLFQRSAIIVGATAAGKALVGALRGNPGDSRGGLPLGDGYHLLGFVDDGLSNPAGMVAGLPVLGSSDQLVRLARTLAVDEIIVALPHQEELPGDVFEAILDCRELGIPVSDIITLYEQLTGRIAVPYASHNIELATYHPDGPFLRFNAWSKRLIDLTGGLVGLMAVLALGPTILVVNALTSPGPLFFRQQRVGRGGRPFPVLKFRSMVPDAEKGKGAVWAASRDDRITPAGRWLRRTHLDELPQVLNVLRGEMSLVGPRPERPEFVGELTRQMPLYRTRHCIRPGLTGWAQVHQQYGDSVESAHEKLEYDLFYIKYASLLLDGVIILRTIAMVLGLRGR
jgi:exopolysaccharide biosynthesis polyprenyl glycosylphosphotransferase